MIYMPVTPDPFFLLLFCVYVNNGCLNARIKLFFFHIPTSKHMNTPKSEQWLHSSGNGTSPGACEHTVMHKVSPMYIYNKYTEHYVE